MTDHRSAAAQSYRHLYKSAAWTNGRLAFLSQNPLCIMCLDAKRTTPATVVDHIEDHKGDLAKFFSWSNWQPLCKPHHDASKQRETARGFSSEAGLDGWPTDPRHPANR